MDGLEPLLKAVAGAPVLVVGDALLDEYVTGSEMKVCREGPAPTVRVSGRRCSPGGAANVAANVAALGGDVHFLSVVGDDADGLALTAALAACGVPTDELVTNPGRRTVAKRRVVLDQQLLLRLDEGDVVEISAEVVDQLVSRLWELVPQMAAVVVSDYGCGTVTNRLIAELARSSSRYRGILVVDAHDVSRFARAGATLVKPNYDEVRPLLQLAPARHEDRADAVVAAMDDILSATGAEVVAVTLDQDGAVVGERGRPPYRTWTRPVRPARACGAGDAYTAAFTLALAAAADTRAAAELAQVAATLATGSEGTAVCSAADLRLELSGAAVKIGSLEDLVHLTVRYQRHGRRVVFTNGCFDLLHRGHVDLLHRARRLGDVLVVGLNSDRSVTALKGPGRPVNPAEDRARVLAALGCVDHITVFDDLVASRLVQKLRPDVYVKGGDYTPAMLPEAPHVEAYGGTVEILPYVEDRSTTSILQKIRT